MGFGSSFEIIKASPFQPSLSVQVQSLAKYGRKITYRGFHVIPCRCQAGSCVLLTQMRTAFKATVGTFYKAGGRERGETSNSNRSGKADTVCTHNCPISFFHSVAALPTSIFVGKSPYSFHICTMRLACSEVKGACQILEVIIHIVKLGNMSAVG